MKKAKAGARTKPRGEKAAAETKKPKAEALTEVKTPAGKTRGKRKTTKEGRPPQPMSATSEPQPPTATTASAEAATPLPASDPPRSEASPAELSPRGTGEEAATLIAVELAPVPASGSDPTKPETQPAKEVDARLPAPGTVLQKRDRQGLLRCECVVEADGIRYSGTVYRSLSAAALAAAKDLGLKAESANGFAFWGLSKPNRPRVQPDPLAGLSKRWETYVAHVEAALEKTTEEEARSALLGALERQARILMNLHAEADESASTAVAS